MLFKFLGIASASFSLEDGNHKIHESASRLGVDEGGAINRGVELLTSSEVVW